jgi:quercetin dioxygenase-like cupin family protein
MLTVMRGGNGGQSKVAEGTFSGKAWQDLYIKPSEGGVAVGNIYFEPCARTLWHSHSGGQLLIIVAGEGFVATEDEKVTSRTGDIIWTPPGVRHWHGATADRFVLHTAVTMGVTTWETAVSDETYSEEDH